MFSKEQCQLMKENKECGEDLDPHPCLNTCEMCPGKFHYLKNLLHIQISLPEDQYS